MQFRERYMATIRVLAIMFSRVREDDRHRRRIWKGVDVQLSAHRLGPLLEASVFKTFLLYHFISCERGGHNRKKAGIIGKKQT